MCRKSTAVLCRNMRAQGRSATRNTPPTDVFLFARLKKGSPLAFGPCMQHLRTCQEEAGVSGTYFKPSRYQHSHLAAFHFGSSRQ